MKKFSSKIKHCLSVRDNV